MSIGVGETLWSASFCTEQIVMFMLKYYMLQ